MSEESASSFGSSSGDGKYTVVARRYRPRSFEELVGQETVSQALATAIQTGRVGHAYLFTGARGVGKTSTARIFAKALNAPGGPNVSPDPTTDVALSIDAGSDMDVIEIDGASNRGIEEIRQLRANVNVRPSRSRYKIYIIDEVHMLTTAAFNALLKTLEEPPEHVKFIFCTTDPEKIPITVLSRCQRFDFSPVKTDAILERLKFICQQESATASDESLQVIARRAAGSMRDSQSLLEQLLSFSAGKITVEKVHEVLGTADESMLAETCRLLIARDGAGVLKQLDQSISSGMDPGQFGEQLLGYLRDLMAISVGASSEILRTANPSSMPDLSELSRAWGTTTILAAIQVLDESLVKMRYSVQGRILIEVALIQICQLQDLQRISDLIAQLSAPTLASPPSPSRPAPAPQTVATSSPVAAPASHSIATSPKAETATASPIRPLESEKKNVESIEDPGVGIAKLGCVEGGPQSPTASFFGDVDAAWKRALDSIEGLVADYARLALRAESIQEDRWRIVFPIGSELAIEACESGDNRKAIQDAVAMVVGRSIQLTFLGSKEGSREISYSDRPVQQVSSSQRVRAASEHPYILKVCAEFGGEVIRVDPPSPVPPPKMLDAAHHLATSN